MNNAVSYVRALSEASSAADAVQEIIDEHIADKESGDCDPAMVAEVQMWSALATAWATIAIAAKP